jgi:hypothetical protein
MKKAFVNEVKELIKEGKLQEALKKFYNELDSKTIELFNITNGEMIKITYEESEMIDTEEEGNITSFDKLEDENYYVAHEEWLFGEEGIAVYELDKYLLDCLLEKVA